MWLDLAEEELRSFRIGTLRSAGQAPYPRLPALLRALPQVTFQGWGDAGSQPRLDPVSGRTVAILATKEGRL